MGMQLSKSKLSRRRFLKEPNEGERTKARKEGKILNFILLGAGESGKTTFLRQMRNLYGEGFTEDYRNFMKPYIVYNIIEGCMNVLLSMKDQEKELTPELEEVLTTLQAQPKPGQASFKSTVLSTDAANAVNICLENKEFVVEAESHSNYLIQDSWFALAEKMKGFPQWGGENWLPSPEDILFCRIRTAAITDTFFKVDNLIYRMVDVSGQRGQRKKYMHLFNDMNVVLFVQSLGEYNLNLFELPNTARFVDSLQLWRDVVKSNEFSGCIFILFFNKRDIFTQKYYHNQIPLPTDNQNFRMPPKVEDEKDDKCDLALKWYEDMYLAELSDAQRRRTRVHVTTATDENIMQGVTAQVSSFLVNEVLQNHGLPGITQT